MDQIFNKSTLALLGVGTLIGCGLGWSFHARQDSLRASLVTRVGSLSLKEGNEQKQTQLEHGIAFFGETGQNSINESYVIVFGVGGVGSHVISSLARSGVVHLKIVDFDRVSLSSLNRHAFARQKDVGRSKVECVRDYISLIFPETTIDIVEDYVKKDNVATFFESDSRTPTYVVDCIDNIEAKVELLAYCKSNNIKVISSMGAGMKADPTRIQIRDIADTNYDDLSRAVRTRLRKYNIQDGIPVVLSVERTERELLPLNQQQEKDPEAFRVFSNYRLRIVPVLGTMPALFAYALSSYVLCDIAGKLYTPFAVDDVKQGNYAKVYNILTQEARKHGIAFEDQQFDMEDVYVLCREIFGWSEVIGGKKVFGGILVRWNPECDFTPDNIVLLTFQDGKRHNAFTSFEEVRSTYSESVISTVQQKAEQFREFVKRKHLVYK